MAKAAEPILTHYGSYDAVSTKEVPFGGLDDEARCAHVPMPAQPSSLVLTDHCTPIVGGIA